MPSLPSLASLLDTASSLPPAQQRRVACLLGAAVADAAARPLHWVYDMRDMRAAVAGREASPEFLPTNKSPFYSLATGDSSCYWDESKAVLTALASSPGDFSYDQICSQFHQDFGPGSPYSLESRQTYMQLRREGKERQTLEGKWLHGGMIQFLAKGRGDPGIKETDGFCCSLPAVAQWAGDPALRERVVKIAGTQSSWPVALRHAQVAARIVELFLLGRQDAIQEAGREAEQDFPEIAKELAKVTSHLAMDHVEAVGMVYGSPCYNPGSFLGAIHSVQTADSFEEAVRQTLLAGGCTCSRAFFIGAMVGARDGLEAIPRDWVERTWGAQELLRLALIIVK